MKLTIIPEGPLAFDGENYLYSEGEGLYIDSIAKYFDEIIVCAYAFYKGEVNYESTSQYRFKSSNIKFIELPLYRNTNVGVFSKFVQMYKVCKKILADIKNWDLIYLFLPGYPSAIAFLVNKLFHKPYFVYLASDWVEESSVPLPWGWTKKIKIFYPLYYTFTEWVERKIVTGSILALTAGRLVYKKYENYGLPVYETVPRLNWSDLSLYLRDDTCQETPIRLLFVGYLLPSKGLNYLIKAASILAKRGSLDFMLVIVGAGPERKELEDLILSLNLSEKVRFLGHVPNGPDLFNIYRKSDIFILPTLGEGFPRVLYEAMSQSIPIITTNVSGIPYKMRHEENALLIPPMNPEAIADAVERIIKDSKLRKRLINNGQKFMEKMLEESDGGRQVHTLLKKHHPEYHNWIERRDQ